MADKGFAIRCPYCRKWNVWEDVKLEEVALASKEELKQILRGLNLAALRGEPDSFSHFKLWRCTSPRWFCPASFEAFVCRSEEDAFGFLEVPKTWSFERDFRLYKADCRNRWEGEYYGILFCTQPVPRQGDIEFESLMNRELLSRLIVGMSVEMEAPLTVYAANIFEPEGQAPQVYWMPVEAYSRGRRLVPPRYNKFCDCCRNIVIKSLVKEFEAKNINVNNCPIGFGKDGKCVGKEATCMEEPKDWNHCPAFTEKRKECPCYNSDLELIRKVEEKWRLGESMEDGVRHKCRVRFREVAFPIIVHDHLAGVAMTGQVLFDPKEIVDVGDFINQWDILKGYENDLEKAKQELIDQEKELKKKKESRFFITEDELYQRIKLLRANIERVTEMANSRYHDIRGRSEATFRQEVLGLIESCKTDVDFFDKHVSRVLERMRVFWAFEAVYLTEYSFKTKDISVIAFSTKYKNKSFGMPGKKEGSADVKYQQRHPCPYLHRKGRKVSRHNPLLKDLLPIFEEVSHDAELEVPEGEYYFFVLIPFLEEVYAFVFAVRDEKAACRLERQMPGYVSELCQEAILGTCAEVIYRFSDVRSFVELRERAVQAAQLIKMTAIAAQLAHTLSNRAGTIPLVVKDIKERLRALEISDEDIFERFDDLEMDAESLMEIKDQLYVEDYTKQLAPLDVSLVVEQAIQKARLATINSNITVSAKIPKDLLPVRGVKAFLVDTFVNLLQNAAQANAKHISVTAFGRLHMIDVVVSDDGDGISESGLENIWVPFYTGKKSGKDKGFHMGLWVSKSIIINLMSGDMSVESKLGKGSRFTVTLKVAGKEV